MQSNKSNEWFYLPRASLRISLDRLNPSNSYFQGPPNQSLLFHLPKNGRGNASPKKVGTNKAVSTGEEKNKPSSRARSISCKRQFRPMNLCLIRICSNKKSFRSRVKLGQPCIRNRISYHPNKMSKKKNQQISVARVCSVSWPFQSDIIKLRACIYAGGSPCPSPPKK